MSDFRKSIPVTLSKICSMSLCIWCKIRILLACDGNGIASITNVLQVTLIQKSLFQEIIQRALCLTVDRFLMGIPHATTIAMANPRPNPSPAERNSTMSTGFFSEGITFRDVVLLHPVDRGRPQKPLFPRNEMLENVEKWGDCGILPSSLLYDRFNIARKSKDASSWGILLLKAHSRTCPN